ncbi:MAG: hypothetical protein LUH36_09760, partial [Oscillospiraceae bacterium]|nr:hypothetical protein [Oscillospiraceae bacterium]
MVETAFFVIPFVAAFVAAICAVVTSLDSDNIFWKIAIYVWSGCNFLDVLVFGLKTSAKIFLVCIGMMVFIPAIVFVVIYLFSVFRFIPHAKSIADCYCVNNARSIIYNANGKVELYN